MHPFQPKNEACAVIFPLPPSELDTFSRFKVQVSHLERSRAPPHPPISLVRGSPRTFNNYFPSKEAAIVWPTTWRGSRLAASLEDRPADEPLADALAEAVAGLYEQDEVDGL